ncbi:putative fbd-associated F-box protein at1g61330 [Phtheirospermum japonicum]|uniref:Putative fbd-associated F-box protein at1g61330 n=1 Tax=Phtheirospermum japonicum TaxID=374723 RepID=A0A830CPN8_9LAMI|nr:putative fbd-associated F-box protein at1g61330 [Phtheirospermum japonicum]
MSDDVIEMIVSRLPVKKVFGLAILSSRFRYSWKFCRDLSFDRDFARNLSQNQFKNLVNTFFHMYLGTSADRFHLYFNATGEVNLVGYWIDRAVNLGIKVIELDFTPSDTEFLLSHELVDAENIKVMKLVNCELNFSLSSNGLSHLRELTFQNIRASPMVINKIFNNCLALTTLQLINCNFIFDLRIVTFKLKRFEKLVLKDCIDVISIVINAPTLRALHYHGKVCKFEFECELFRLYDVILDVAHPRRFHIFPHRKDMVNYFAYVETLTITSIFLELVVSPESFVNPSDIVVFLKKCPHIERIFIDLGQNALQSSVYWAFHGSKYLSECDVIFSFLKCIKVKGFTMKELPVTMARYFLKSARSLQHLILVKAKNFNSSETLTPEHHLRRGIQSNAVIEFYDYNKDVSIITPMHLKGI